MPDNKSFTVDECVAKAERFLSLSASTSDNQNAHTRRAEQWINLARLKMELTDRR